MESQDSGLQTHLVERLLPEGGWALALYEMYLDESGTDDGSAAVAVGGYVVRAKDAKKMDRLWRRSLADYDLPYFHMVDCAHGASPFDKMSLEERVECQKRFMYLTKKFTEFGVCGIIPPRRYNPNDRQTEYAYCVEVCLMALHGKLALPHSGHKVAVFLEAGHRDQALVADIMEKSRKDSPSVVSYTFAGKCDLPILQAADILVWQCAKYVKDKASKARPPRKDYSSLVQHPMFFIYTVFEKQGALAVMDEEPHIESEWRDSILDDLFNNRPLKNKVIQSFYDDNAS